MKIQSVLISNYKGINMSISLSDGINVITGENGSGKSNILEAVRLALGEEISFCPDAVTKNKNIAFIKVTLADKSIILDKYSIMKKLYKSGKVKTFISDDLPDNSINYMLLDYDSHCFMNQIKLEEFVKNLKEKAKNTQIIIVTQSEDIINIADRVYYTQKVGDGYTLAQNRAVA